MKLLRTRGISLGQRLKVSKERGDSWRTLNGSLPEKWAWTAETTERHEKQTRCRVWEWWIKALIYRPKPERVHVALEPQHCWGENKPGGLEAAVVQGKKCKDCKQREVWQNKICKLPVSVYMAILRVLFCFKILIYTQGGVSLDFKKMFLSLVALVTEKI